MDNASRILVVEDEVVLARSVSRSLTRNGFASRVATSVEEGREAFATFSPSMVFVDYRLGSDNGLTFLNWVMAVKPGLPVVMITAHGDIELAVRAMKAGAADFLVKPVPLNTFTSLAKEILGETPSGEVTQGVARISGRSVVTDNLHRKIQRIAVNQRNGILPPVMITAPQGAGKTTVAKALHETAENRKQFVVYDCALPKSDQPASFDECLEQARNGALLLRHVDALSDDLQAHLLNILQAESMPDDFPWILSASNLSWSEEHLNSRLRMELLYKLRVGWIEIPPLKERPADIFPIAEALAAVAAQKAGREAPRFSTEAKIKLFEYSWPGNIRELANCVEAAVLVAEGSTIHPEEIQLQTNGSEPGANIPNLEDLEGQVLQQALQSAGGNVSKAARLLGISRDKLRYRMQKFGLSRR